MKSIPCSLLGHSPLRLTRVPRGAGPFEFECRYCGDLYWWPLLREHEPGVLYRWLRGRVRRWRGRLLRLVRSERPVRPRAGGDHEHE